MDRPAGLRQAGREGRRDRNEKKASSRADGRSVKATERQTGVCTKRTARKRRRDLNRQAGGQTNCQRAAGAERDTGGQSPENRLQLRASQGSSSTQDTPADFYFFGKSVESD